MKAPHILKMFLFTPKSALSGHYNYFWRVLQIATVLHDSVCTSDHDLYSLWFAALASTTAQCSTEFRTIKA